MAASERLSAGEAGAWLEDAIALVPTGDVEQNLFRACLFNELSAALVSRRMERQSVADVVAGTAELMHDDNPAFAPRFHARLLSLEWPAADRVRVAEAARTASVASSFLRLR